MVQGLVVLMALVMITWMLEIVDWLVPGRWMDSFGIQPAHDEWPARHLRSRRSCMAGCPTS